MEREKQKNEEKRMKKRKVKWKVKKEWSPEYQLKHGGSKMYHWYGYRWVFLVRVN